MMMSAATVTSITPVPALTLFLMPTMKLSNLVLLSGVRLVTVYSCSQFLCKDYVDVTCYRFDSHPLALRNNGAVLVDASGAGPDVRN